MQYLLARVTIQRTVRVRTIMRSNKFNWGRAIVYQYGDRLRPAVHGTTQAHTQWMVSQVSLTTVVDALDWPIHKNKKLGQHHPLNKKTN